MKQIFIKFYHHYAPLLQEKIMPLWHKCRPFMIWGGFSLIIMTLLWGLIWNILAFTVQKQFTQWLEKPEQKAYLQIYNNKVIGFPTEFKLLWETIRYRHPSKQMGWQTNSIIISPKALQSLEINADFPETQFFSYVHQKSNTTKTILLKSKQFHLTTSLVDLFPNPLIFTADETIIEPKNSKRPWHIKNWQMSVYDYYTQKQQQIDPMIGITLTAKTIIPHHFWATLLETPFTNLQGQIFIRHPSRLKEIHHFSQFLERDYDRPEILIDNLTINHALSDIRITGRLLPDKKMNWHGNLVVYIKKHERLLNLLEKKSIINSTFAHQLRLMFSLDISKTSMIEDIHELKIDLEIKNNLVYHNHIPIGDLRDLF